MLLTLTTSLIILFISMLLMIISLTISKKSFMDREKLSPFECGFDPKSSPRLPFSLHFFLIAMIFLIFDVEITLLIPLIMILKISSISNFIILTFIFLFILLMGLYHEWNQNMLTWTN